MQIAQSRILLLSGLNIMVSRHMHLSAILSCSTVAVVSSPNKSVATLLKASTTELDRSTNAEDQLFALPGIRPSLGLLS